MAFREAETEVSFVAPGHTGGGGIREFLAYLATVDPQTAPRRCFDSLEISDDYNVILTTRPRGSIPANLWACSYFIFIESKSDRGFMIATAVFVTLCRDASNRRGYGDFAEGAGPLNTLRSVFLMQPRGG